MKAARVALVLMDMRLVSPVFYCSFWPLRGTANGSLPLYPCLCTNPNRSRVQYVVEDDLHPNSSLSSF